MTASTWSPKFEGKNNAGLPLVLGKLETYAAGTSTPLATFTDQSGATPNGNPVQLDAAGRANVWLTPSVRYKLVLKDALGVTIWTVDNFSVADPSLGPSFISQLFTSAGATLVRWIQAGAGAVIRTVESKLRDTVSVNDFGADPTGNPDSAVANTLAFAAAIATGKDVVGNGTYTLSGPVRMPNANPRQRMNIGGLVKPTFIGSCFFINGSRQRLLVHGDGSLQPAGTAGSLDAFIVIGETGANAVNASVAGCSVVNYKGHAWRWENGPEIDFTGSFAQDITGDGYLCTGTYDDNNHGNFRGTHIVRAGGIGYNIKCADSNVFDDANASRAHVFSNAKAFQCGQNFKINSTGNIGSVFSELGVSPDEYGPLSAGNKIKVIETRTALAAWVDNATQGINTLEGYNSFHNWVVKNMVFSRFLIQGLGAGRWVVEQVTSNVWQTYFEATTDPVLVTHGKGSASKATHAFDTYLLLPGGIGSTPQRIPISNTYTTILTPTPNLAAGAIVNYNIPAAQCGAGLDDTVIVTVSYPGASGSLQAWGNIESNGDITPFVKNQGGSTFNAGIRLRVLVIKHLT